MQYIDFCCKNNERTYNERTYRVENKKTVSASAIR